MLFPFRNTSRNLHTLLLHIYPELGYMAIPSFKEGWEIEVLFWLVKYTANIVEEEEEEGTGMRRQLIVLAASSSLTLPRSLKLSTNGTFCSDPS